MNALQVTWFLLIGVLFIGYSVLDGFDLGVGFWHLWTRDEEERRTTLASIGPVWDGNEVWLLTAGGALFAAFPHVYATVFSGFYLALILVLFSLILRAVSIEFRNKEKGASWRRTWDVVFAISSALPMLLFGVALGNILRGIPLDASMTYKGGFFTLLNPYAILIGLTGFAMLAAHGAFYLVLKTSGRLQGRARKWANSSWLIFLLLLVGADVVTALTQQRLLANYRAHPLLWGVPILALGAVAASGLLHRRGAAVRAFLASGLSLALLWVQVGTGLYPNLVPALSGPETLNLTIHNASSSKLTLEVMLVVALVGMPLVLGYTAWVYRTFSGKVSAETEGY